MPDKAYFLETWKDVKWVPLSIHKTYDEAKDAERDYDKSCTMADFRVIEGDIFEVLNALIKKVSW